MVPRVTGLTRVYCNYKINHSFDTDVFGDSTSFMKASLLFQWSEKNKDADDRVVTNLTVIIDEFCNAYFVSIIILKACPLSCAVKYWCGFLCVATPSHPPTDFLETPLIVVAA